MCVFNNDFLCTKFMLFSFRETVNYVFSKISANVLREVGDVCMCVAT